MKMKKSIKNKKGFTLIELLVTIALMLSILGIAIISFINISNRKKEEAYKLVTDQIMTAAEQYFDSNEYLFEGLSGDANGIITVGMLVNEDYLNKVTDPRTGHAISNCTQVKVTKKGGKYTSEFIEYKDLTEKTCKNDNSVIIAEPGAPSIELEAIGTLGENKEWYVSYVDLKATINPNNNGPISNVQSCQIDGNNKCDVGSSPRINADYTKPIEIKGITDTNGITIGYKATNTSNKSIIAWKTLKIDTISPTCEIRAVGDSKKAITPYNPTGTVETSNNSSYDGWFTGNVRVIVESSDRISFVKEGSQTVTINGRKYTNVKGESNGVNDQANKDTNGKDIMFSVEDNAGNQSNCKITLKRDTTPPICGIRAEGNSKKRNGNVVTYNTTYNVVNMGDNGDGIGRRTDVASGTENFNGWYTSNVNVYPSAEDAVYNTLYNPGDETSVMANGPKTINIPQQTLNSDTSEQGFYAYAEDEAGNWSSCEITVKRDATAPTCGIRSFGYAKKAKTDNNPEGQVGTYNTSYNIESGERIGYTHPHIGETRAILPEGGWYTSRVRVFPYSTDNLSGSWITLYSDDNELHKVQCKVENKNCGGISKSSMLNPIGEKDLEETTADDTANRAFYAYAEDNAGNWSSCQINVKKDSTPPYIRSSGAGNTRCLKDEAIHSHGFSIEYKDNLSTSHPTLTYCSCGSCEKGNYVTKDTGASNTSTTNYINQTDFTKCPSKTSQLKYTVEDEAGNTSVSDLLTANEYNLANWSTDNLPGCVNNVWYNQQNH